MILNDADPNILDHFNHAGIVSENPVEKIKENFSNIKLKRTIIKKCLIIGVLSHLLHFLLVHNNFQDQPEPSIANNTLKIPKDFGQISIKGEMVVALNEEVTKVKIYSHQFTKLISFGYIKRIENTSLSQSREDGDLNRIQVYVPVKKFEKFLSVKTNGFILAPYETSLTKEKKYEIEI